MSPLVIFTDDPGWHGEQLQQALQSYQQTVRFVSLNDCMLDLGNETATVRIPGIHGLPKQAMVRGIAGGTLQQVIARLDCLHALELLGVRVMNTGRAIERTVDKAMTSLLLRQAGVPTPATWVLESRQQAHDWITQQWQQGHQLVIKPLFGSQGTGVRKLQAGDVMPLPGDLHVDGLFYLQRFIQSGVDTSHDYRVFVIGQRAVAAMTRHGQAWINNVALGASVSACHDEQVMALAVDAARALNVDYCGVDIIRDLDGRLYVLEINGVPAWKGLQSVSRVDIAGQLAQMLLA